MNNNKVKKTLMARLRNKETLVCDGAMGTSLQAMGLPAAVAPEEWNISNPSLVQKVHKDFVSAGCDMLITNTFGANQIKLERTGHQKSLKELNTAGVLLAKQAAGDSAYVLGDIGPTGGFLKPLGDYVLGEFYDAFFNQAVILHKYGVDAFIIETMSSLDELRAAVTACKALDSNIPVIASMTFVQGRSVYNTMMGVSVKDAVSEMVEIGCDALGANCGLGINQMIDVIERIKYELKKVRRKGMFLIAQPNAGMPKLINNKTVFSETALDFAASLPELLELGVNIIGGCCGTTPEHIREIARAVRGRNGMLRRT